MELQTARLRLREFQKEDWRAVLAYAKLESVVRFMSFEPYAEEDAKRFVRNAVAASRHKPRTDHVLAIVPCSCPDPVGVVHLSQARPESPEAEISFALRPDFWGQGIVPEACAAVLDYAFGTLKLHRVFAECHPDNRASSRVMEKLGMRHEGTFRQKRRIKGRWWDISHYAILDDEFADRR